MTRPVAPVDPKSDTAREISTGLGRVLAQVDDRLAREQAQQQIRKGA